ncbi:MAG: hypothetical protein ACLRPV_14210 [Lacrimispora saccharolytica]
MDTFGMKVTGTKKITLSNALGQKLVIQVTEDEIFCGQNPCRRACVP